MDIELWKRRKKERKMTFEDLAKASGVSLNGLKNIFNGITPNPRIDTITSIEKALGLDNDEFDLDLSLTPSEISSLFEKIAMLTDEECKEISEFTDYVISKRKKE